ncbi:MAG: hypothetical protein ACFFEY_01940 [Candidatus Thorarchaeota archaeon]
MSEQQLYNLEKIKELTKPIEKLQIELNQLTTIYSKISIYQKDIRNVENDKNFLSQIKVVEELLQEIFIKVSNISKLNLNKFLDFQDNLIRKYKEAFKNNLKSLNIDKEITKRIGLFLIENKYVSKVIDLESFVSAIEISQWLELLDSLKRNTLFIKAIKKTKSYYQDILRVKLKEELKKIPENTDPQLIREYEKIFIEDPDLSFSEFLRAFEKELSQEKLKVQKDIIKKIKEKEELEKLKKKQEQLKDLYEEYLKLSDKEFERLRRKKSREKLPKTTKKSQEKPSLEISDEVSEKIKKFKSQLEKGFKEEYMVQKDEDKDPLDLVRERKRKKEKEYKSYKDHFNNL